MSEAKKVSRAEIYFWRLGLLLAFLALWEVATRRGWVDPFFVSRPSTLAALIVEWIASGFIFRHLWVTMQETIIGFLLGTVLGVTVGFLFARWEKLALIFDPLMVALNAMPRVVLAPLFILWFGLGLTSKVVMVISLVFFVVFFSTYTGIREVDRDLVSNARILGATPGHMIRHVLLPSALTWIFSSLRTSVGFAYRIVAEDRLIADGDSVEVLIDPATRRPREIPATVRARIASRFAVDDDASVRPTETAEERTR